MTGISAKMAKTKSAVFPQPPRRDYCENLSSKLPAL
jgi:hypothetical protein